MNQATALYGPSIAAAYPQIAFAAAPVSLSGVRAPSMYDGSVFASTRPEKMQSNVLSHAPLSLEQACIPSVNVAVDQDPLASIIRQVYMESTGVAPMPADITLDVLHAAKLKALQMKDPQLVALTGMAYGSALASSLPVTAGFRGNTCSMRSGVPVPAVMASNALITQQVANTLQAFANAPATQQVALASVPTTLYAEQSQLGSSCKSM